MSNAEEQAAAIADQAEKAGNTTITRRPPRLVPVTELIANAKPTQWLVRHYLPQEAFGVLFGPPAVYKSFQAIDWAACVATGTPWNGQKVHRAPVVYINGEGPNGIKKRLVAWQRHHKVEIGGDQMLVSDKAVPMIEGGHLWEVLGQVDQMTDKPGLFVIDTLSRAFGGGDENGSVDMGAFVDACEHLRHEYSATVLVVHHSSKADPKSGRGHTRLKGAIDTEFCMSREKDAPALLTCTKMKDDREPDELGLEFEQITLPDIVDDEGFPAVTGVLLPTEKPAAAPRPMTPTQRLGVVTFAEAMDEFMTVRLEAWRHAFYAKHTGDSRDTKNKAFNRMRAALADGGAIIQPSEYVYQLTPNESRWAEVGEIAARSKTAGHNGTRPGHVPHDRTGTDRTHPFGGVRLSRPGHESAGGVQ
ncbi:helicase RepA family protein [Guyparkeria hydrothermalis]|uniref:AAA family ATPase n=1 Tax=Guyparkeria hydrothermalis TaxID=923 RepID=UPI00201FFAC3|nr:AAA family ATPase [Guyparkeria hydrothermalis]MCL7744357.1 helicase RepA family protein [Guyparkeria hydrothermalis]